MILDLLRVIGIDRVSTVWVLSSMLGYVVPAIASEFNMPPRGKDIVGEVHSVISRQR